MLNMKSNSKLNDVNQIVELSSTNHVKTGKLGKNRLCKFCRKDFKKPSDLIRHERVHTNEKPFKCEICFKLFSIKSNLTAHLNLHKSDDRSSNKIKDILNSLSRNQDTNDTQCNMKDDERIIETGESDYEDLDDFKTKLVSIEPKLLRPDIMKSINDSK